MRKVIVGLLALLLALPAAAQNGPNTYVPISKLPVPASGSAYLSAGDIAPANRTGVTYQLRIAPQAPCPTNQVVFSLSAQLQANCAQLMFSNIGGFLSPSQIGGAFTNGQLLIGNSTTNGLVANTLTAGSNITVDNSVPGHITISASGTSTITIGTSLTAANPQVGGDATTGLVSLLTQTIGVDLAGTEAARFTTTGLGIGSTVPRGVLDLSGSTGAELLPVGTTGTRPGTGVNGMVRYNSTTPAVEGYINNAWGALALTTGTVTNATNAANVGTVSVSTNASFYPLFVASSSNGNQVPNLGIGFSFNPSTNTLTATTFSGALSGNATTSTTATNATNTAITDDISTNATVYPTWVTTTTGNLPQKVSSTKIVANPSTGAVGLGTNAPSANAVLDLHNATNALYLPVGTTGTRPTAANGMIRYNTTVPQLEAYINNAWTAVGSGGSSTFASSGMTTAASGATNATALQAAITAAVAIGTSGTSGYAGVQAIGMPAGTYAVSSAVTNSLSAVKLIAQAGPVKLNYVGLGTSAVALAVNNDSAPSGDFVANANGANDGCALNGTNGNINVSGPLAAGNSSTTSIGIRFGSTTATPSDDKAMRQSCGTHFQAQFFGYGFQEYANNFYMNSFDHFQLTYNNCGLATNSASSNVNSGENITWSYGDISGNNYAFCDQTPNMDHVFGPGISFDNNQNAIFLETVNAGYSTQRITGDHLEDFTTASPVLDATGICSSVIGANAGNTIYIYDQNKFVWNYTAEVPFNHFIGCVGLSLLNNTFAGYGTFSSNAALSAYYMADANVIFNKVSGNNFASNVTQKQLLSASLNIVQDPTFATGTNTGNFLTTPSTLPTWTIDPTDGCVGITPTVDTSTTWSAGSGVASMKFTYSAGSNGCAVDSTAFAVQPGDHLLGDIIVNGGTTSGTGTIMGMFFRWIPCNPATASSASDEIGDDLNDIYGGGARTAAAKIITLLDEIVPPGVCWAQMVVNPFGVPSAKSVWILDAEVNKI